HRRLHASVFRAHYLQQLRHEHHRVSGSLPRDANGRDGAGVQSATKPEHAAGLAASRYIETHHQRFVFEVERVAVLRCEDPVGVDVLEVRSAWGKAEYPDPEEVAILAVVDAPLLDQFFIREPAL